MDATTKARFERLENRVKRLEQRKPVAGSPGPTGPQGPAGPAGPPGPPGKDAAAPAPSPETPEPNGRVLFDGSFDNGFKGWGMQSLPGRATLFSKAPFEKSAAFEGSQAARFEVREGDVEPATGSQRSELYGPTFDEGQTLYIRDAIRLPSENSFNAPWQIVQQLHEEEWRGSPGLAVMIDNDYSISIAQGDGSPVFWRGPVLERDRWYDLIYRVRLSQDPVLGFVEVWMDRELQSRPVYGQTMQTSQTQLKAGIYRSKTSTGTSIVEHDAIVVGTSYVAVAGG